MDNLNVLFYNTKIVLIIHVVIVLITYTQLFLFRDSFPGSEPPYWIFIWTLILYFIAGFFLTGKVLMKQTSALMNLLSLSFFVVIGLVLWALFFFTKQKASGGWISMDNIEWSIYLSFFPYSLPLLNYVDTSLVKISLVFVPVLPTLLMWFGMQLRK